MSDLDSRVIARAHQLWVEAGSPANQTEADFLTEAGELVAIEESEGSTLLPNPLKDEENRPYGEPAESILAVKNQGEFPTLTDEGEGVAYPSTDNIEAEGR